MEDQGRCLSERHYIEGRQLEVKLPQSKSSGLDEVVYPGVSAKSFLVRLENSFGSPGREMSVYFRCRAVYSYVG